MSDASALESRGGDIQSRKDGTGSYIDSLRGTNSDLPPYMEELDRAIASYAKGVCKIRISEIDRNISLSRKELKEESRKPPAEFDLDRAGLIGEKIENLSREKATCFESAIYQKAWRSILTRNGRISEEGGAGRYKGGFFPSRTLVNRLLESLQSADTESFNAGLESVWPSKSNVSLWTRFFGKDDKTVQGTDIPKSGVLAEESSALSEGEPAQKVQLRVISGGKGLTAPVLETEPDPATERNAEGIEGATLSPSSDESMPKKRWARRALGAAFNMAAGVGAGVAVRTSVLALTGGSVVAAIGAGAAFSGLLSVGRQHNENVRARRAEDPQAQGWALHREVFAQNKKSYLNKFLTSAAIFAGGGALGFAYGEQVMDWVSSHVVEPVASLFHSAASPVAPAELVPVSVPHVEPLEAAAEAPVSAPTPVETAAPAAPGPAHDTAPVPASVPVTPEPDSRTLMMQNVQNLIAGEKASAPVQDALRRAASENARVAAQGFKDLADHFGATSPSLALQLAEESLKINPQNAQAALFTAHYQTHGIGGAPVNLQAAYETATQVQTSPTAGGAQKREAAELARYITRILRFAPA